MRLPGFRRAIRSAARFVRRARSGPSGLVLLYHRVAELEHDPWDLAVAPAHFAEHLRVLRQLGSTERIDRLVPALADSPARPVFAITFDDGYADNLEQALPILRDHDMPATVFVVSDTIDSDREFWWDALERVFLATPDLPRELRIKSERGERLFNLGDTASLPVSQLRRAAAWRCDEDDPPGLRQAIFLGVWNLLMSLESAERDERVLAILDWAGLDPAARPTHRILTGEAFDALAADDLIEIGAHTRTHPSLPDLSMEAQRDEILGGKAALEARLGSPVTSFSYPFGRYTPATRAAVAEAGFDAAGTSRIEAVTRGAERHTLPRVQVKDWNAETFRRAIEAHL